jgi:hypothetical protein
MPHYYFDIFDIKDGQRPVDPAGLDFKNDDAAIARAKVIAIGVSIDKPAVDPKQHIAVLKWITGGNFQGAGLFETINEQHSMSNNWAFDRCKGPADRWCVRRVWGHPDDD